MTAQLSQLLATLIGIFFFGMMKEYYKQRLPAWGNLYRALCLIYLGILVGRAIGSYLQ